MDAELRVDVLEVLAHGVPRNDEKRRDLRPDDAVTGVLFACLAGLFFGALNITMRWGLERVKDVDAGSAVIATVAFVIVAIAAVVSGSELAVGELWPFVLVGVLV